MFKRIFIDSIYGIKKRQTPEMLTHKPDLTGMWNCYLGVSGAPFHLNIAYARKQHSLFLSLCMCVCVWVGVCVHILTLHSLLFQENEVTAVSSVVSGKHYSAGITTLQKRRKRQPWYSPSHHAPPPKKTQPTQTPHSQPILATHRTLPYQLQLILVEMVPDLAQLAPDLRLYAHVGLLGQPMG